MKIQSSQFARQNEHGMATMVFMVLLSIMMILIVSESRALVQLHRETKFLEQQQIKRLNGPATNAVAAIAITSATK